jgi:uncharacterized protein
MKSCITSEFIDFAKARFRLDWTGIHGAPHWSRVRHNGLLLAEQQEGDPEVIQWFAFLHDLERHDDYRDPEHGVRAAMLAREINDEFMRLSNDQLILLEDACTHHSDGHTEHDPTVMICWDADRLDLGRVGIYPDAQYLCTALAKNSRFIDAAYDRSMRNAASSENMH